MYELKISVRAQEELEGSLLWYKERSEIASLRFKLDLERQFKRIKDSPRSYQNTFGDFYQIHLQKYPFTVVYSIEDNDKTVLVGSIFHQKRNPNKKYK